MMSSNINQRWRQIAWPYGVYKCENGEEVLFNRMYQPIWKRLNIKGRIGHIESVKDLTWRVPGIISAKQLYFYRDANIPERDADTVKRCMDVMNAFCSCKPIDKYGKPAGFGKWSD
jgi:hypothetical protein